ncbi:MAG: Teichoic acid translocation permease protein TagG [Betaproteobacteria bacterium ADurb.Bin341]|nr:MAG: Teichoic acid translocation permease protein TagG [Betaproteobacteria bacterium ADurb.Bin341]
MLSTLKTFYQNRGLLLELVKRDVLLRYRGAWLGLVWVLLNPLIMLGVYSYAFGYLFQLRGAGSGGLPYVLNLYCGLIAFNIFGETVSRAPTAVRSFPSYVKKIVFPVNILPIVPLGSSLLHAAFNLLILAAALAWTGHLSAGILLYPLFLIPIILFALGLGWFFAAWGVFIRDVAQVVPVLVQISLFLSPILYPSSIIPAPLRPISDLNPLAAAIEAQRAAILGTPVAWNDWMLSCLLGVLVALLGLLFFEHSRDEFADVM